MYTYIARRLMLTIFILFSLSIIVFVSIHAIPGDIVDIMLDIEATPESAAALKKALGLDKPIYIQYLKWFSNVLQANLGDSLRNGRPVIGEILYRLPVTLQLILYAMIISLFIAIPVGIAGAVKQNSWFDHILRPISIVGLSVPSFWWGILFIIMISYYIPSFYSGGYVSIFKDFWGNFKAIFPPALALDAVYQRDYPMVQGSILAISFLFVMVNLVVDLLYGLLDPRIRIS